MGAATIGDDEQAQPGLFGRGAVQAATHLAQPVKSGGAPRVMAPQRDQIELPAVDLETLLVPDHAARTVWGFVQSMDLALLYARIKSMRRLRWRTGHRPGDPCGAVAVGHHRWRRPGTRSRSPVRAR